MAVAQTVERHLKGRADFYSQLKWPNDVWVQGRKICGVLTDASILGNEAALAVGLGINVNQAFPDPNAFGNAISLRDILGNHISREEVLGGVCASFDSLLQKSMKSILSIYKRYDILLGNRIRVHPKANPSTESFDAVAVDIDSSTGHLIVRLPNNTLQTLIAEEVSVRPEISRTLIGASG